MRPASARTSEYAGGQPSQPILQPNSGWLFLLFLPVICRRCDMNADQCLQSTGPGIRFIILMSSERRACTLSSNPYKKFHISGHYSNQPNLNSKTHTATMATNQPVPPQFQVTKAFPPRASLQQYRLASVTEFLCFFCQKHKKSKLVATRKGKWDLLCCNGCYGLLLSKEKRQDQGQMTSQ